MGKNPLQDDLINKRVMQLAVMEANCCSRKDKLKDIYGIDIDTASKQDIHNADCCMSRDRKSPMYEKAWKEEQRSWDFSDYSLARKVFRQNMRQKNDPWLAMNSAVNAISNAGKRIFHDEDKEITVRIEGLPDIGSPDDD